MSKNKHVKKFEPKEYPKLENGKDYKLLLARQIKYVSQKCDWKNTLTWKSSTYKRNEEFTSYTEW